MICGLSSLKQLCCETLWKSKEKEGSLLGSTRVLVERTKERRNGGGGEGAAAVCGFALTAAVHAFFRSGTPHVIQAYILGFKEGSCAHSSAPKSFLESSFSSVQPPCGEHSGNWHDALLTHFSQHFDAF